MIDSEKSGLDSSTQEQLNLVFSKFSDIKKVVLYGSRAKGNFKHSSDIDLVVFAPSFSLKNLLKIEDEIDDLLLPYKVDLSLYHLLTHKDLMDHIHRVGLILYENNIK